MVVVATPRHRTHRFTPPVLYLVEGIISISFAPIAYYLIPNSLTTVRKSRHLRRQSLTFSPRQARFLNEKERELAAVRYEINKENYDPDEKFSWHEVRREP